MSDVERDDRSPGRRARDEQIAAEPRMKPPMLPPDASAAPVEALLATRARRGHPVAVAGVVENGLVRPLDPAVKLAEHSRVIIVASDNG